MDYKETSCHADHDLTFYFGVRDETVNSYLTPGQKTLAFAQLTSYDFSEKWGKGFIWVTPDHSLADEPHKKTYPDWSKKNTLLAILAHEIGHILGTEHVPGTLMADDFANRLQNAMFSSPKFSQDLLPDFTDSAV